MLIKKSVNKWGKEYFESDNFNWSCRTHLSEFGVIWWCCGKSHKDAIGCNVSKHESKEDEDEDDEDKDQEIDRDKLKLIRCTCWKQKGHLTIDCPKDPNFRMDRDVREEFMRVLKMGGGEDTKVFDNLKLTSDLLKLWSK